MAKEQAVDLLNQALAKLLGVVTDSAGKVVDVGIQAGEKAFNFLSTEIPDVIQQLLWWKFTEALLYFVISVVILITAIIVDYKVFQVAKTENDDGATLFLGWGLIGCVVRVPVYIYVSILFNFTWLQIWIAPKIYLLEYAAKLIGGK